MTSNIDEELHFCPAPSQNTTNIDEEANNHGLLPWGLHQNPLPLACSHYWLLRLPLSPHWEVVLCPLSLRDLLALVVVGRLSSTSSCPCDDPSCLPHETWASQLPWDGDTITEMSFPVANFTMVWLATNVHQKTEAFFKFVENTQFWLLNLLRRLLK